MNFLSIDCSTSQSCLFLKIKNKTFFKDLQSIENNNDALMKKILEFFDENKARFSNISNIFVNQGPGTFSGIRTAISVAKGIKIAKNIDLSGYSIFLLSAAKFYNYVDSFYCILQYRKKYFVQKFNKKLQHSLQPKIITVDEIAKKLNKDFKVLVGSSLGNFDKKIQNLNNVHVANLSYKDLEFLEQNKLLDKKVIRPIYLS